MVSTHAQAVIRRRGVDVRAAFRGGDGSCIRIHCAAVHRKHARGCACDASPLRCVRVCRKDGETSARRHRARP